MKLPFLISVPHGGLYIPPEVRDICILQPAEVYAESDSGAAVIFHGLLESAVAACSADIARAIVDLNRDPDDFSRDGVIKTHTCFNVPVYREFPSQIIIEKLLSSYYYPYHQELKQLIGNQNFKIGVDCHTMAPVGPPAGHDAGKERPLVCVSNAGTACPDRWLGELAGCFHEVFPGEHVAINSPFRGGYIIRSYSSELPWIQVEVSRTARLSNDDKAAGVMAALSVWSSIIF